MLTDDVIDGEGFGLKEIYDQYDREVFDYIDTFNGETVDGVEEIFEAIIETANSHYTAEQKAKIKAVFGEIGIYTPLVEEEEEPSATPKPDKDNSGGGDRVFPGKPVDDKETEVPEEDGELIEVNEALTIAAPEKADTTFEDVMNHWAKDYIASLEKDGIVKGYDTGLYGPDWGITREELAVVMVRVLKLESKLGTAALYGYHD